MDGYLAWFDANCRRSKELTDEAMELIPGGVQHNLAFNYPFPLAIEKAEGARLWDVDGNEYIDFLQAGGPTVLGSNYEPVRRKVAEVVEQSGPVTGLFHEYELKLAELVSRLMPACEMFRMLGSGTESVMARHPRRPRVHRQEVGDQGRRRVPRLERPDGLRPARARDLAVRGQGHPLRGDGSGRERCSPTTWTRCAGS